MMIQKQDALLSKKKLYRPVLCLVLVVSLKLLVVDDPSTLEQRQAMSRTSRGKQEIGDDIRTQSKETNKLESNAAIFDKKQNKSYPFNDPFTPVILSHAAMEMIEAIPPRAYPYRINNASSSLPCFPPKNPEREPVSTGLLLLKPKKVGGSTVASVHMRMARNAAHRMPGNDQYASCDMVWYHSIARKKFSTSRDPEKSLLWTVIRHPVKRLVSKFQYRFVGKENVNATAENFQKYITEKYSHDPEFRHNYLNVVSLRPLNDPKGKQAMPGIDNTTNLIEGILHDYDFVAITERMDESLVAMAILWNVPLGDILYMSSKVHGGYDDLRGVCRKVPNAMALIPHREIHRVVSSPKFQSLIEWDAVAYKLANDSLDKTIDEIIGREKFNLVLNQFRQAQQRVLEICQEETVSPCSGGGLSSPRSRKRGGLPRPVRDTDCFVGDKGCGFMCLDDVATELNLWGSHGPLSYNFPRAFGQGPSTKKRLASKGIRTVDN